MDLVETTTTLPLTILGDSITVESTAGFPPSGTLRLEIASDARVEFCKYTGLDGTHFTGVTRGFIAAFPATEHNAGITVTFAVLSSHHNANKDAIIVLEQTLGLDPQAGFATVADRIADAEARIDVLESASDSPYVTINTVNTNYAVVAADLGKVIHVDGTVTITLPNSLTTGFQLTFVNIGTGVVTFTSSVTINAEGDQMPNRWGGATAYWTGAAWILIGDLE